MIISEDLLRRTKYRLFKTKLFWFKSNLVLLYSGLKSMYFIRLRLKYSIFERDKLLSLFSVFFFVKKICAISKSLDF